MYKNAQGKKDIYLYFEKYINAYNQIKLLNKAVDRSEFLKYKIETLFKGCEFSLSNEKVKLNNEQESLKFECKYKAVVNKKDEEITLTRGEIISLRDRTLLAKKITKDYQYFIDSITEIINISNILNEIYIKGYPKIINIKIDYKVEIINKQIKENEKEIEINPQIKYFIDGKEINNQKVITELKNILSEIKENQINAYKTKPFIRYIYGRQFNLLYNDSDPNKKNKLEQLLKYITNNSEIKMIDKYDIKKEGDLIQNNIQDWNKYIQKVLDNIRKNI